MRFYETNHHHTLLIVICCVHAMPKFLWCDVMDTALVWNYGLNICSCTSGEVRFVNAIFNNYPYRIIMGR